ncbi:MULTISPECIES: AraC family transcriptional regulator [unclassified Brevibacterium]|uniref:helix-turn-helix transcriptional regulator n=1 Tax=unclassified Brevibacterium TaxID=2614124 RepID=UPI0008BAA88C|nr:MULTISPECIES: helix-turn-helix domain-containing protein [unclassified Brevibacterium]OFL64959.1 hypothetical protein HMPREF2757_05705 [Brevibacterium sp. HMSC063G07]OFS24515.1 hypothetical protein HMPREF3162_11175 [Brevibacterium sp. HMSC07C04]
MGRFSAVVARTETTLRPTEARAFDYVRFIFIRAGTAVLFGDVGERPVRAGDVVVLAPNTLCGSHPEGSLTTTTIYAELDYLVDQTFWQHADALVDRHHAWEFISCRFPDSAHIVHIGSSRLDLMLPWLDQLVELSLDGATPEHFFRVQACFASILDALAPFFDAQGTRPCYSPNLSPSSRYFRPVRIEAVHMRRVLETDMTRRWTITQLAAEVHLSPSQAHRIFVQAYGQTPLGYQSMVRAREMARLLRRTNLPVQEIAGRVGWNDRSHAARVFHRLIGVNPTRYRKFLDDIRPRGRS